MKKKNLLKNIILSASLVLTAVNVFAQPEVRGQIESVRNGTITGWICEPYNSQPMLFHVYVGRPYVNDYDKGTMIGFEFANKSQWEVGSQFNTSSACGDWAQHHFVFQAKTEDLQRFRNARVFVHAINYVNNPLINGSGWYTLR